MSFPVPGAPQILKAAKNDEPDFKARNMPKSMADLGTQLLCMILFLAFVIVSSFIHQIEPKELNSYENRWFVYYFQIIGVAFTILGISCQYYVKNKSLRNGISFSSEHLSGVRRLLAA